MNMNLSTRVPQVGDSSQMLLARMSSALAEMVNRPAILTGTYADPNGYVIAGPGSIYFDLTNPAAPVQWVKGSGTGNTGWI